MRNHLRSIIIQAWRASIEEDYSRQRINSERSLQASLWSKLNDDIGPKRRMFIEPGISYQENDIRKQIFPDIVICNTREVVAVIELKYHPRVLRPFTKDLENLNSISKHRSTINLRNSRFKGLECDSMNYKCSEQILFIWAGVHRGTYDENNRAALNYEHLEDCYLELHAETQNCEAPEIYYYA